MSRTLGLLRLKAALLSTLVCASSCCAWQSAAQTASPTETRMPPPYTPQVWDIDWSYLRDPKLTEDWTDKFHFMPLGSDKNIYLSINGQVRERGEYQDHPGFGAQPPNNGYFLQRYLLSADLHIEDRIRGFAQWDSGLIEGRDGGPRPGIDEDRFDFNQAFVEFTPWRRNNVELTARAGRQLVSLGSTRLVAIGAGLNVEQPFDGFRLTLKALGGSAEALALRPTLVKTAIFDNEPNPAEELWGLYLSHPFAVIPRSSVDLYYLGLDHKQAHYQQGTGREQRETIGTRLWSHTAACDYDFEYTGQFGWFGAGDIRAWGTGYHFGCTLPGSRFQLHPEMNGGFLSGDHHPHNSTLSTFNPLFPNGNYLGESVLLGPYNLVITRPTFKMSLSKKASSNTNVEFLWREATQDGVYNIAGILTHPANGSRASYIGSQIQQELDYSFTRHWSGALVYEHFFAGDFLKQSPPGHGVNFLSPQVIWNF